MSLEKESGSKPGFSLEEEVKNHVRKHVCNFYISLTNINSKNNIEDSIEYARILCAFVDDMHGESVIYTNHKNAVDVLATFYGSKNTSANVLVQLNQFLSESFEEKTKKIGAIKINSIISINKTSSYQELDINLAEINHRKFLLKFHKIGN